MYEVSTEYLEAVKSDNRVFPTRIKFDGIGEYFTNKNLRNGSYENTIDGNSILSLGNSCTNKIEFTISNYNKPYVWKGSRFTVEKGLVVNGATEWVPWGTFWVTDIRTSNDKRTIDITGYDFMYQLSKRKYVTGLVAPFHYRDLLDEFILLSGLTLNTEVELPEADDEDYIILSWPDGDLTYADIAGHLAGMVCTNARISWADPSVIEFTWWTATGTKIHKETRMNGFEKLADSPLYVNILVAGPNQEIVIENDDGPTDGEIDFTQFDVLDESELPLLAFTYNDTAFTASVSLTKGANPGDATVVVPNKVMHDGALYTITSVAKKGFENSAVVAVHLPNTVLSIGDDAFSNCGSLADIRIEEGVTSIGMRAFRGCNSLTRIYIPDSVTTVGWYAFSNCAKLVYASVGGSRIGQWMFNGCDNLATLDIREGVTIIDGYGLSGLPAVTSIVLPNSVTTISNQAFNGCTSLTRLQIGTSADCKISSIYFLSGLGGNVQDIIIYASPDSAVAEDAPWGATNATISWML